MNQASPPKTLAIDFGTKRIGLAVSFGTLAEPLEIIENNPQALDKIATICREQQIAQLLVGISEGEMAEKTQTFIKTLQAKIDLPLLMADETLTTKVAEDKLHEGTGTTRHGVDQYAAAVMLQEWLDEQGLI